ncbi:hypothetical protein AN2307.2 [Aspergillus nidulans FGSC A4]|uniref:Histone-like transcription factor, putative (AFU_orthologue AFUA_5G10620) n=1 Tax=Emericella nidulans (strain FGSC A4 / ATCC 38163 / CBS 112.46 / NRRL 194 / M139) TaxID=227321 RepID=Q5BAX3_EMENI|nr:hypothetical protein [Aspergillus nidulans FGSC A4]EAA64418.1 hypothetical protein AN2307.2 [Aspergillus nidulans FGSC A4]CBF86575.1 TPA: histone-like transcription factor, putative (AFU_orthologue; AFUA_5G10620) [Aspergillus nidulans FGSC A4]|eukprot:XP_659911.1 hypothetical protein AN2307.2 [Aspergillus nidulans FGSC A4]
MLEQCDLCRRNGYGTVAYPLASTMTKRIQELFIQYLVEQGHNVVKSERKPRKTIQYKDLDNLEFLADVIPKTTTYKQFKEKRAKESGKDLEIEKGQRTLNGSLPPVAETEKDSPSETKEASVPRGSRPPTVMMLVDGPGDSQARDDGDVEMADQ